MSKSIMYYTRSNVTKRVAEKLAEKLDASLFTIEDDKNWSGVFGYLKAGYYASTNKSVKITYDPSALEADEIILLSPLWAGGPSSAVRTLLKEQPSLTPIMVLTNDGSSLSNAYDKTKSLFPRLSKFYGVTKKKNNEDEVINDIVKSLS